MSEVCPRKHVLSKKLPWVLLVWDNVGGWDIVKRGRTPESALRGWKGLLKTKEVGYALLNGVEMRMPQSRMCNCEWHKKRRKHFHPCTEGCEWMVACGRADCRHDLGPKWICRVCLWRRDHGRPPTADEMARYSLREYDARPHS